MTITRFITQQKTSMAIDHLTKKTSTASFKKTSPHHYNTDAIEKGVEFDEDICVSTGIVEKYDNSTFILTQKGVYKIEYSFTINIHNTNLNQDHFIRPMIQSNLTVDSNFENYEDGALTTTRTRIQTSSNLEASPSAVDTIHDSCVFRFDGPEGAFLKLASWGANSNLSYIEPGASFTITYICD